MIDQGNPKGSSDFFIDKVLRNAIISCKENGCKYNYLRRRGECMHASEVLMMLRQTGKLYEKYLEEVRKAYGLTVMEIRIIGCLYNNPDRNTVGDIAEIRMLSKGNVSRSVELLIQKGILERETDQLDRRWIRLKLKDEAMPIVNAIEKAGESYIEQIFTGFSEADRESYEELNQRLTQNILIGLERK